MNIYNKHKNILLVLALLGVTQIQAAPTKLINQQIQQLKQIEVEVQQAHDNLKMMQKQVGIKRIGHPLITQEIVNEQENFLKNLKKELRPQVEALLKLLQ